MFGGSVGVQVSGRYGKCSDVRPGLKGETRAV